jgi:hypothetical protein
VTTLPSHERPILLLVPGPQALSEAIRAICGHEDVRAYAFPAVWDLSFGRVDAMSLCPDVRRVDLDNVGELLSRLMAAATPGALSAWTREVWAAIPDRVREHFLRRGGFAIFAAAFRVARPSGTFDPPPSFAADRVREARFETSYRLAPAAGEALRPEAPAEEASAVTYLFDPLAVAGKEEAGLPREGSEAALEVFAYERGRERHRRFLEALAAARGWRVVDPSAR